MSKESQTSSVLNNLPSWIWFDFLKKLESNKIFSFLFRLKLNLNFLTTISNYTLNFLFHNIHVLHLLNYYVQNISYLVCINLNYIIMLI